MADELELLRRANPVPVDGPHYGDGPLDHDAERRLNRLLHERPAGRRRTRLAWSLAATAVVAATVLTLLLGGPSTPPAVAAPRPLVVQADSTPVPLQELADRAQRQAAAENILGLRQPFSAPPFFWSAHYDVTIRYVGRASGWDAVTCEGDFDDGSFVARYFAQGRHCATATIGRDRENLEDEQMLEHRAQACAADADYCLK